MSARRGAGTRRGAATPPPPAFAPNRQFASQGCTAAIARALRTTPECISRSGRPGRLSGPVAPRRRRPLCPACVALAAARRHPAWCLQVVPGAGHFAQLDQPELWVAAVERWLAQASFPARSAPIGCSSRGSAPLRRPAARPRRDRRQRAHAAAAQPRSPRDCVRRALQRTPPTLPLRTHDCRARTRLGAAAADRLGTAPPRRRREQAAPRRLRKRALRLLVLR